MSCFPTAFEQPLIGERCDPFTASELKCLKYRMTSLIYRLGGEPVTCGAKWIPRHNGSAYVMSLVMTTNQVIPDDIAATIQTFIHTQTTRTGKYLCRDLWYPVATKLLDHVKYCDDDFEGLLGRLTTAGDFQSHHP